MKRWHIKCIVQVLFRDTIFKGPVKALAQFFLRPKGGISNFSPQFLTLRFYVDNIRMSKTGSKTASLPYKIKSAEEDIYIELLNHFSFFLIELTP